MTDYAQAARNIEETVSGIMSAAGIGYSAEYRGEKVKALVGEHPMDEFKCVFTRLAGQPVIEEFEFFMGVGNRELPKLKRLTLPRIQRENHPSNVRAWIKENSVAVAPHPASVLNSIILDASAAEQTFAQWCDDFGYDSDSRKALATYEACQQNADKLRHVFTSQQIAALRDAVQDY